MINVGRILKPWISLSGAQVGGLGLVTAALLAGLSCTSTVCRPGEFLGTAGIGVTVAGLLLAGISDAEAGADRTLWRLVGAWAAGTGMALVLGNVLLALATALLGGATAWLAHRAATPRAEVAGGPPTPLAPAQHPRVQLTQLGSGALYGLLGLLILLDMVRHALQPGGHALSLGWHALALALLGVVWAGNCHDRATGARQEVPEAKPGFAWPSSRSLVKSTLLCLGMFLALAGVAKLPAIQRLEGNAVHAVRQSADRAARRSVARSVARFSALAGREGLVLWAPALPLLLWGAGRRRAVVFFVPVVLGTAGLELVSKGLFPRLRPGAELGATPDSFPSGHTLAATVLAASLVVCLVPACRQRFAPTLLWGCAAGWILLVGASRVYLARHHPSDVLAAVFLGFAWVSLSQALFQSSSRLVATGRRAYLGLHPS